MAGLSGVSGINAAGGVPGRIELEAQFQAAALRNQQDVQELLGEQSIRLIQSASVNPQGVGQLLDVTA